MAFRAASVGRGAFIVIVSLLRLLGLLGLLEICGVGPASILRRLRISVLSKIGKAVG